MFCIFDHKGHGFTIWDDLGHEAVSSQLISSGFTILVFDGGGLAKDGLQLTSSKANSDLWAMEKTGLMDSGVCLVFSAKSILNFAISGTHEGANGKTPKADMIQ